MHINAYFINNVQKDRDAYAERQISIAEITPAEKAS